MLKNIHITVLVTVVCTIATLAGVFKSNSSYQSIPLDIALYEPVVVLELFTSQGCSSCPSADLLLQKVKEEYKKEVFALSYHVDYWNYIGWKDPFSKAVYSKKQKEYNIKFKNKSNYTPQLVVNGKGHFVGSDTDAMYRNIEEQKEMKSVNYVSLKNIRLTTDELFFEYDIKGMLEGKKMRVLLAIDQRITKVNRGENKNRTLKNSNVVVAEVSNKIDGASGAAKIAIPAIVSRGENLNLFVLVETPDYDITAAAKNRIVR